MKYIQTPREQMQVKATEVCIKLPLNSFDMIKNPLNL